MLYGDIEGRMGPDATEVDTFETDMSEYESGIEVQVVDEANVTPNAKDGTTLAETTGTGFDESFSLEGNGLNYYPQAGDECKIWLRFEDAAGDSSTNMGFNFGAVDTSNYYRVLHQFDGDTYLQEFGDQGQTLSNANTYNQAAGEWVEFTLRWPADPSVDPIELLVSDESGTQQGSVSSTHSNPHTGRGVGLEYNGQSNSAFLGYWDWYRQTGTY